MTRVRSAYYCCIRTLHAVRAAHIDLQQMIDCNTRAQFRRIRGICIYYIIINALVMIAVPVSGRACRHGRYSTLRCATCTARRSPAHIEPPRDCGEFSREYPRRAPLRNRSPLERSSGRRRRRRNRFSPLPVLARAQYRVRHAARRIAQLGVVRIPLGDRMLLALVALARGASDDVGVGSRVARSVHDDLEVLLHIASASSSLSRSASSAG